MPARHKCNGLVWDTTQTDSHQLSALSVQHITSLLSTDSQLTMADYVASVCCSAHLWQVWQITAVLQSVRGCCKHAGRYIHLHLPGLLSAGLLQLGNLYQWLQWIQNTAAGKCEHITAILREMHWRLYDAKSNSCTPRHCMARLPTANYSHPIHVFHKKQ